MSFFSGMPVGWRNGIRIVIEGLIFKHWIGAAKLKYGNIEAGTIKVAAKYLPFLTNPTQGLIRLALDTVTSPQELGSNSSRTMCDSSDVIVLASDQICSE
jgi:hypothetical protein